MADEVMIKIVFACSIVLSVCVWILNPLTIAAIVRSNTLRTTCSNIFILNLAVADLLLMTVILVTLSHRVHHPEKLQSVHSASVSCFLRFFVVKICVLGSVMSSFAIAVDRFLFICKPLRYPGIVTIARVVASVVLMWLVSLGNSLVPFFKNNEFQPQCEGPYIEDVLTTVSMATTGAIFFILHIISSCMYVKMFFIIRSHHRLLQSFQLSSSTHLSGKTAELQEADNGCNLSQPDQPSSSSCSHSHQITSLVSVTCSSGQSEATTANQNLKVVKSSSGIPGNDVCVPGPSELITTAHLASADDFQIADIEEEEDPQEPMIKKFHDDDDDDDHDIANQSSRHDVIKNRRSKQKARALYFPSSLIRAKRCITLVPRHLRNSPSDDNSVNECESVSSFSFKTNKKKKKSGESKRKFRLRDLRTIKSLMLMGNLYVLCWGPVVIIRVLTDCFQVEIDRTYFYGMCIFGLANPIFNFIVFPLRKAELRNTIMTMLSSFKKKIVCATG